MNDKYFIDIFSGKAAMTDPLPETSPADQGHRTLSDQAYTRLRHDVIQGAFSPGAKLGIGQLRAAYGVGATPLREALHRLGAEGFVVVEGQRGFRVADISARELRELTELRIVTEGLALRESVEQATEDWESRVVVAFHHLQKIEKQDEPDPLLWEARNNEFHLALISQCQSRWLMRIYELLYDQHRRYRVIARTDRADRNIHEEHVAMMEAALARDINTLLTCHEAHIRNTQRTLEHRLQFDQQVCPSPESLHAIVLTD
jgi:DNA-binding GntR family transcriptional regulator